MAEQTNLGKSRFQLVNKSERGEKNLSIQYKYIVIHPPEIENADHREEYKVFAGKEICRRFAIATKGLLKKTMVETRVREHLKKIYVARYA